MPIRPMGPCQVLVIKRDLTTFTIPKTHGGVRWTETEAKAEIKFDQTGTVPADKMSQGHANVVEIPVGVMDFSVLTFVDPSVFLVVDAINPNKFYIFRAYRIGGLDSEILVELQLTQYKAGKPSADPQDTIIFTAAAPQVAADEMFNADTQRAYKYTFFCYQDLRRADLAVWILGDASATPA